VDLTGKLTEEQVDQLKRQWAAAQVSGFTLVQETDHWDRVIQLLSAQTELLQQIRDELVTMNDQGESPTDDEPDMFATLNGPRNDMENPLKYGVKGEYGE
jgi:hypothetical protein